MRDHLARGDAHVRWFRTALPDRRRRRHAVGARAGLRCARQSGRAGAPADAGNAHRSGSSRIRSGGHVHRRHRMPRRGGRRPCRPAGRGNRGCQHRRELRAGRRGRAAAGAVDRLARHAHRRGGREAARNRRGRTGVRDHRPAARPHLHALQADVDAHALAGCHAAHAQDPDDRRLDRLPPVGRGGDRLHACLAHALSRSPPPPLVGRTPRRWPASMPRCWRR